MNKCRLLDFKSTDTLWIFLFAVYFFCPKQILIQLQKLLYLKFLIAGNGFKDTKGNASLSD